jgi:hypothetical protein
MANERLFELLSEAYAKPSKTYQALQEGFRGVIATADELEKYGDRKEKARQRLIQQNTLRDILGENVPQRFSKIADIPQEQVEGFGGLRHLADYDESDIDSLLKRELIQARIDSLRNPPPPKPTNPLDDEYKRERIAQMKKGPGSTTSVDNALNLYETAREGLLSGLEGSRTGPFAGRIPAVTEAQQTAEGGVSAMAPVLKQLFRVAGEGVFTDRDQEILIRMIPTRTDHPEARRKKIANIDSIVKAKLGVGSGSQGVATSGPKVKVSNGTETLEIDPTDIPDAVRDGYRPIQ